VLSSPCYFKFHIYGPNKSC